MLLANSGSNWEIASYGSSIAYFMEMQVAALGVGSDFIINVGHSEEERHRSITNVGKAP